jgi:hypothetical protein
MKKRRKGQKTENMARKNFESMYILFCFKFSQGMKRKEHTLALHCLVTALISLMILPSASSAAFVSETRSFSLVSNVCKHCATHVSCLICVALQKRTASVYLVGR